MQIPKQKYTDEQMEEAFKSVHNEKDWKARINKTLSVPAAGRQAWEDLVFEAVLYYTATFPEFTDLSDGRVKVTARGYRMGPAGDH